MEWVPAVGGGELGGDDLVHHGDVRLDTKDVVGQIDRSGGLAACVSRVSRGHDLTLLAPLRLHGVAQEHKSAVRTGNGALDQDQVALRVAFDDFEVERGDAAVAHLTGHATPLEHASGCGAGADRTRGPVLLVIAVRCRLALEVVALHHTGEALALADARDVDTIAGDEDIGLYHLADLETGEVGYTQLGQMAAGRRAGHREVAQLAFRQAGGLGLAERELDGAVAVAFWRLQLHDATGPGLDDGHRDDPVLLIPDLSHAELAPENAFGRHLSRVLGRVRFTRTLRCENPQRSVDSFVPGGSSEKACPDVGFEAG